MTLGEEEEIRHKKLIEMLATFIKYSNEDGTPFFKYRKTQVSGKEPKNFDDAELYRAAAILVDVFNLSSGSTNDFNLFILIREYFKDEKKRLEINKIIGVN